MADIDEEEALSRVTDDETGQPPFGRSRDEDDPWEKGMLRAKLVLGMLFMPSIIALMFVSSYASNARDGTESSLHLAGYKGLNATTMLGHSAVVSPVFALKVRAENPRRVVLQPWCYYSGEVTVSYSDVVLAWGHMPCFCVKRRETIELTVVAVGREVGLLEDLRGYLASDLHAGTAQIMVDIELFYEELKSPSWEYQGPSLHPF